LKELRRNGRLPRRREVGETLFRSNKDINWKVVDRVAYQLKDPRMGQLAGKISPDQLLEYANSATAKNLLIRDLIQLLVYPRTTLTFCKKSMES
jgi:hypothetical protein